MRKLIVFVSTLVCLGLPLGARAQAPAASPSTAGYVPNTACQTCHGEEYDRYLTSPHARIPQTKLGERAQPGCQSCHGPGETHTQNPGSPGSMFVFTAATPQQVNSRCLACHSTGAEQMNFKTSTHAEKGLACTNCHSIHHPKTAQLLLKAPQPDLCYACHVERKTEFNLPTHHKVNEGLVQCSDCHNPHGSAQPKQLRTSTAADAVCFTCHADKRGPFVYEHQAVKVDGCLTCHNPHGSSNSHLLRITPVNILCMQCHTASSFSGAPGTPSFHNQTAQYQSCLSCHTQIHGSNFSPVFFY